MRVAETSIHPCSHYNAICNHRFQNTLQLRTHDEPSIAKHHQGTNHTPKRTDRTRRAHEVPFILGRNHFIRKKQGFVLRLPPPKKQCNMNAAITVRFAALRTHLCGHDSVATPHPKVIISLGQHFPKSPHSLRHHFPSSPSSPSQHLQKSPGSLRHHFLVTTSLGHHFHKSPHQPAWMYRFVM